MIAFFICFACMILIIFLDVFVFGKAIVKINHRTNNLNHEHR